MFEDLCGPMSPKYGPASECKLRRRFPDIEDSWECAEQAITCTHTVRGGPPAQGLGWALTTLHIKTPKSSGLRMLHGPRTSTAGSYEHDH